MTRPKSDLTWKTVKRKPSELVPLEVNPRTLSTDQAKALEKSLKKFGLVEIPAINTDGKIIAGHQRIAVLILLGKGKELIDVRIPSRKLTPAEVREYNVRSNQNTGSWDYDLLANHFDVTELLNFGFTQRQLDLNLLNTEKKEKEKEKEKETEDPFETVKFVLHRDQAVVVDKAIQGAISRGEGLSDLSGNKDGNALTKICETYLSNPVED